MEAEEKDDLMKDLLKVMKKHEKTGFFCGFEAEKDNNIRIYIRCHEISPTSLHRICERGESRLVEKKGGGENE